MAGGANPAAAVSIGAPPPPQVRWPATAGADAPVTVAEAFPDDFSHGRIPAPAMLWTAEGFAADQIQAL
jgi:hypothetical protein